MTRIKNRNDRYSPFYQVQAGLCLLTFLLLIGEVVTTTTTTTTAQAETIERGSGR